MTDGIVIRDAAEQDFDLWYNLWTQYNAFYGREGATALSEEITLTTWQRFLSPQTPVHCLVAQQDGRLRGLAHYVFHLNTIMIDDTCYLQDLFTEPSSRGGGLGRNLITEVLERARQAKIHSVYWHTHASNETAMRLYDQVAIDTSFTVYRKSLDTSAS